MAPSPPSPSPGARGEIAATANTQPALPPRCDGTGEVIILPADSPSALTSSPPPGRGGELAGANAGPVDRTGDPRVVLNAGKQMAVLFYIRLGASRRMAAQQVGCCHRTIARAAARDPDFAHDLARAEADADEKCLQLISRATDQEKYWRAAAWVLERRNPEEFAARRPHTFTGDRVLELFTRFLHAVLPKLPADCRDTLLDEFDDVVGELSKDPNALPDREKLEVKVEDVPPAPVTAPSSPPPPELPCPPRRGRGACLDSRSFGGGIGKGVGPRQEHAGHARLELLAEAAARGKRQAVSPGDQGAQGAETPPGSGAGDREDGRIDVRETADAPQPLPQWCLQLPTLFCATWLTARSYGGRRRCAPARLKREGGAHLRAKTAIRNTARKSAGSKTSARDATNHDKPRQAAVPAPHSKYAPNLPRLTEMVRSATPKLATTYDLAPSHAPPEHRAEAARVHRFFLRRNVAFPFTRGENDGFPVAKTAPTVTTT